MKPTMFQMVQEFHKKFNVPVANVPSLMGPEMRRFRERFLEEELQEFRDALDARNMVKACDALCDLVYVALGTAAVMGLPFDEAFDLVQKANMSKSKFSDLAADDPRRQFPTRHPSDVVKPQGWVPPEEGLAALLRERGGLL